MKDNPLGRTATELINEMTFTMKSNPTTEKNSSKNDLLSEPMKNKPTTIERAEWEKTLREHDYYFANKQSLLDFIQPLVYSAAEEAMKNFEKGKKMNDIPAKSCEQCGARLTNHQCYAYSNEKTKKPSNLRDRFNDEWENIAYKLDHALDYPTEAAREQLWIFFNQELQSSSLALLREVSELIGNDEKYTVIKPGSTHGMVPTLVNRIIGRNEEKAKQRKALETLVQKYGGK